MNEEYYKKLEMIAAGLNYALDLAKFGCDSAELLKIINQAQHEYWDMQRNKEKTE